MTYKKDRSQIKWFSKVGLAALLLLSASSTLGEPAAIHTAQSVEARRIDLSSLPKAGSIVWGKPQGQTVTIFTDFRCAYCRALASALEQMNVRVVERPISLLGSRSLSNRVYCAKNKARAVRAAYTGEKLPKAKCDTSGLDANERFAHQHGFSATPIIVRQDGAVVEGFRSRASLEQWLKGS